MTPLMNSSFSPARTLRQTGHQQRMATQALKKDWIWEGVLSTHAIFGRRSTFS